MSPTRPKNRRAAPKPVQWLRGLLRRPLRLERRGLQIHLLLDPPSDAVPAPVPASPPSPGAVLRQGHDELRALLRRHPEARHLMRHLGFVEQALGRSGSRALRREVPVSVLRKALDQLDLLARDEPSDGLAALRRRIADAARERDGATDAAGAAGADALQVSEASHSLFEEMERSWTGRMPLSPEPPPAG